MKELSVVVTVKLKKKMTDQLMYRHLSNSPVFSGESYPPRRKITWVHATLNYPDKQRPHLSYQGKIILGKSCLPGWCNHGYNVILHMTLMVNAIKRSHHASTLKQKRLILVRLKCVQENTSLAISFVVLNTPKTT